jgi:hypothetical protein
MTDEEIATGLAALATGENVHIVWAALGRLEALHAEVERLRGWRAIAEEHLANQLALERENATLREVARETADRAWYIDGQEYACAFCDKIAKHPAVIQHLPDCIVVKARALLASES